LNASDVGFGTPLTKGSRVPSGRTMKMATGACCPRDPLNVT
jgi:hypothetical protein